MPLGALPGTARMVVDVQLLPRDPSLLARYATAVSTPGDPLYRRYLSRGRFASEFGPTTKSVRSVVRWLAARGLPVRSISSNHLTLQVATSAAALDRSLAVGLERYRLAGGRIAYASTRAPRFGLAVRGLVQGVVGLDDISAQEQLGNIREPHQTHATSLQRPESAGPAPCATASADATKWGAYTADELATAYNFTGLYATGDEGAGVTIAVFEEQPNLTSDIAQYQACYGTNTSVSYIPVDGGATGTSNGEAPEDIEVVLGLAPEAHLDVYQGPHTATGTLDLYTAMVDQDTAQVISTSYGGCEAKAGTSLINAEETVFEQAAVQGQSVFAASGDNGSSDCSTSALAVNNPASQPYVTGVGGTTLTGVGPPPAEVTWNESATHSGAGGGGLSSVQAMPTYQSTAGPGLHVINNDSSGQPCGAPAGAYCREVPDVSADSDWSTGYVIYYNGQWYDDAGTSAAAPLWAALMALTDASPACAGTRIGFANPALYKAAATSYASDFHDITTGSNADGEWGDSSSLYPAGVGYDMATGLGTPNGANLAATLCGEPHVSLETTNASLSLRRTVVTYGAEGTELFTVQVDGKPGDGQPLGAVAVYSFAKRLCSHVTTALTSDASVGRCSLSARSLKIGRHALIYAVFMPNPSSSSDAKFHYTASQSKTSVLTVRAGPAR